MTATEKNAAKNEMRTMVTCNLEVCASVDRVC
jgi:hypothetical protein